MINGAEEDTTGIRGIVALGVGLASAFVCLAVFAWKGAGLPSGAVLTIATVAFAHSWAGFLVGPLLQRGSGGRGIVGAAVTGALIPVLALILFLLVSMLVFVFSVMLGIGWVWRLFEGELENPALTLSPLGEILGAWWVMVPACSIVGVVVHMNRQAIIPILEPLQDD